jgi:histidyl-tRNA synthetase
MAVQKPDGTQDMLPNEALFWNHFKSTAWDIFSRYGYQPIETPLFEQTDLFVRGIGESTDVVSKEMFQTISGNNMAKLASYAIDHHDELAQLPTSEDCAQQMVSGALKSKSRLSMRPEGTAGTVRAIAQHGLITQGGAPVKLMYAGPMFRAERPQKGRQRQFNQVGVECLGAEDASIDAEGIIMLMRFYREIGIPVQSTRLLLNSIGCASCRPAYRKALKDYLLAHADFLCEDCVRRADINPLRAFDCKNPECQKVMENAPRITDYLCDDCRAHYHAVTSYLDAQGITYSEDPTLVRGLDYYTRTVFEIQVDNGMGSQNAIGGGGRYDGLMKEIGGTACPGFGFALGYERCALALSAVGIEPKESPKSDLYVACVDADEKPLAFNLVQALRDAGIAADMDHQDRSLKSQFKQAGKMGVRLTVVIGPDEVAAGVVKLRDMSDHSERDLALDATMKYLGDHADAHDLSVEDLLA